MGYYILYKKGSKTTKVIKKRPKGPTKGYGFAEGPFKTKKAVEIRKKRMGV